MSTAATGPSAVLHRSCPAKLNLGLRVVGRRPDGYHELDTVFQELALHDDLWITRCAGASVTLEMSADGDAGDGRAVAAGDDNLVVRAARAALQAGGRPKAGLRFALRKRIPAGGGLGGGSSDAAAALLLTDALLGLGLEPAQLVDLAVGLGADVAFFLRGGTQRGTGIGEQLVAVPDPPRFAYALVLPPFGCDTAAVFAQYHRDPAPSSGREDGGVTYPAPGGADRAADLFCNDLEPAALRLRPQLAALRAALLPLTEGRLRMSGSGSTLFAWRRSDPLADPGNRSAAWVEPLRAVAQRAVPGTRLLVTTTARAAARVQPARWGEVPT